MQAKKAKQDAAAATDAPGGTTSAAVVAGADEEMVPGMEEVPPGDPEAPMTLDAIQVSSCSASTVPRAVFKTVLRTDTVCHMGIVKIGSPCIAGHR